MNSHYSYSPALALLVKQKVDVTPRFAKRALTSRSAQDLHEPYVCHEMRGSVSPEPNILYKALVCQNASKMLTKEKELAEVAENKLKQLTEEPAKDRSSIKNFSKVLVFILGFNLL